MTKKDYIAIATIIREHLEDNRKAESHRWQNEMDGNSEDSLSQEFLDARGLLLYELASQLSGTFEASNPAFDRYKFYSACSIPPIGSKILSA